MTLKKIKIAICYLTLIVGLCQCKLDQKKEGKFSLSKIESQNNKMLDSVESRILSQINTKDCTNLLNEADSTLRKIINPSDLQIYLKLIHNFYGEFDTIKGYGTTTTAYNRSIDRIVNFKSGDSLELHFELYLTNHDAKLSYITFNRFKKDSIPVTMLKVIKPKIDFILKKNYEAIYQNCTLELREKLSTDKLYKLLNKNIKNTAPAYTIKDCKPLIFDKGKVGLLVEVHKKINTEIKKIKVVLLKQKSGEYKISDILFSKMSQTDFK